MILNADGVAMSEVFNPKTVINDALRPLGDYALVGRWNGSACELTGVVERRPLFVLSVEGVLKSGIEVVGDEELLGTSAKVLSSRTFRNCTSNPGQATRTFSESVSKSISLSIQRTLGGSLSLSGQLQASGLPALITVAGSKNWSATSQQQQSTSKSFAIGDTITLPIPARTEFDVDFFVRTKRVRFQLRAQVLLDGRIYPCFHAPRRVSDLLSESQRTFVIEGSLEFEDADEGEISTSSSRPAVCGGKVGLFDAKRPPSASSPA